MRHENVDDALVVKYKYCTSRRNITIHNAKPTLKNEAPYQCAAYAERAWYFGQLDDDQ